MTTLPAVMLAAAGIGFGHAVLPDHWMPLAVVARTRRYPAAKTVRLSLAAAVAHVLVSLVLGATLVVIGLQFRNAMTRHTDFVVGGILLVTGLVFLVLELRGRGHSHSHRHSRDGEHGHGHGHGHDDVHHHAHDDGQDHSHPHDEDGRKGHGGHDDGNHDRGHVHAATTVLDRPTTKTTVRDKAGLLIPFGAAASPDLTILPVFLAAGALGTGAAIGSLVAFAVVTIATIVGLTVLTAAGARLLTAPWIDRSANLLTAGTLILIGGLVTSGVI
jgi:nickel/cobalt transporter (NicO) family protein